VSGVWATGTPSQGLPGITMPKGATIHTATTPPRVTLPAGDYWLDTTTGMMYSHTGQPVGPIKVQGAARTTEQRVAELEDRVSVLDKAMLAHGAALRRILGHDTWEIYDALLADGADPVQAVDAARAITGRTSC
jgi:hypothetical protein